MTAEPITLFDAAIDDEVAALREQLKSAGAEANHNRDMWYRLMHRQEAWAKGVRSAGERRAREQAYGLIVAALPDTLALTRKLARAVLALPERPSEQELATVRELAGWIDTHDPRVNDDVRAIAAIQASADAEINDWQSRTKKYFDATERTLKEVLTSDDTYAALVAARWQPPAWRVAKWRATLGAPAVQEETEAVGDV